TGHGPRRSRGEARSLRQAHAAVRRTRRACAVAVAARAARPRLRAVRRHRRRGRSCAKYAPRVAATSLRAEVTDLLSRLIRVDTTTPPGNETAAAELLRGYLEPFGVECEFYARVPERANLVARIRGTGDGPTLLLLGHTDVVLADPGEWTVPPFSGEVRDGEVWGRGALDMKGQVAASAVALASLAREGFEPAGDAIFVAAADEEVGEGVQFGMPWLGAAHPEAGGAGHSLQAGARRPLHSGRTPDH